MFDTSSSRFGAAPSLLAGVLPRWLGENNRLAWSFLTRQNLDVRLGQRITDPVAGAAASAAESYLDQRVEEDWSVLRSRVRCLPPWESASPGTGSIAVSARARS